MYQKTSLQNGLRVLTVPMPHTRSVSVSFYFGAGSRYETTQEAGLSHFVEHLLFKGTKRRPHAQQISEAIEGIGGYLNAGTDREMTVYWAKVARPHMSVALDLLSDMILDSVYDPAEIERERKVILEELSSIKDSPQQQADLLIDEVLWPDQPLGREVGGTKESVAVITREAIVGYVGRQYVPNNAVVVVAGDVGHGEVVEAVAGLMGRWEPSTPRAWFPAKNGQQEPQVGLRPHRTEQAHLCLAYRGLSSLHPDRYALDLLNVVLGEGMSSRLFLEIRERRGLAYDVHSFVSHFLDDGAVTVYAGVPPKSIDSAVESIQAEMHRLKEPVPDEELRKVKEMTRGRMLLRTEDTRSMAGWVGAQELLMGEVRTIDEVLEVVDGLTPDALQRVAQDVLQPEKVKLAVVGPYRSRARFERLVAQ